MVRLLLILSIGASLVACDKGTEATPVTEAPKTPEAEPTFPAQSIAPPPFSADQIRRATHVGRSYEYVIEVPGKPTIRRRMTFTQVDEKGCAIESTLLDEEGDAEGVPTVSHATWEELVGHASYPKHGTEITDAPVETPAGSFDCRLYTALEREEEEQTITRAYFAKDMPGAPVKLVVEKNDELVSRMELVSYIQIGD